MNDKTTSQQQNTKYLRNKIISATEFDEKFDRGEDVTEFLDFSKARRPGQENVRVEFNFPAWMITALDSEAERLGISRQSIVEQWLAERLEQTAH